MLRQRDNANDLNKIKRLVDRTLTLAYMYVGKVSLESDVLWKKTIAFAFTLVYTDDAA